MRSVVPVFLPAAAWVGCMAADTAHMPLSICRQLQQVAATSLWVTMENGNIYVSLNLLTDHGTKARLQQALVRVKVTHIVCALLTEAHPYDLGGFVRKCTQDLGFGHR